MTMTIGLFSKSTGFSIDTIRYYEKEGILIIQRDKSGRRIFNDIDITWIEFIKKLKDTGMPLKEIKRYSELRHIGEDTLTERLKLLEDHREKVVAKIKLFSENLDKLDDKINYYVEEIKNNNLEII